MTRLPKALTAAVLTGALTFGATPVSPAPQANADSRRIPVIAAATIVIGGITWYLAKDGITYIKDQSRTDMEPTPEEKAASQEMIQNNKEEVIAQGGIVEEETPVEAPTEAPHEPPVETKSVDAPRGMPAETGSNSIARLIAALSLAVMILGGVFTAGRTFFA